MEKGFVSLSQERFPMWPELSKRGEKEDHHEAREGLGQGDLYIGCLCYQTTDFTTR